MQTGQNPIICIFHSNCADGFASAWVVRRALGNQVEFHAGVHRDPPPDVRGKRVYIVDFSYPRAVLEQMASVAESITILDHHMTAQAEAEGLPGVEAVFDMHRSGARITWDYFFPGEAPPPLILRIEDADLERMVLPSAHEIAAAVWSYPYSFDAYDMLMATDLTVLAIEGAPIVRKLRRDVTLLTGLTTRRMIIGGHNVPVANLPFTFVSDVAHQLAVGEAFAGCYWDTPSGRVFGLRSIDGGIDVAEIAKKYGGGGRRNASGFRVSFAEAEAMAA
jgi:uncharacterized protein